MAKSFPKTPFILISVTSILVGASLSFTMFNLAPNESQMPALMKLSTSQMIKALGVDVSNNEALFNLIPSFTAKFFGINEASKMLWVLISFFKIALQRQLGQSMVLMIMSITAPLLLKLCIETIKPRRSTSLVLGAGTLVFFTSLGQVITIACATNMVYVPLYTYSKYRQVRDSKKTFEVEKLSAASLLAVMGCNTVAGIVFFWTTFSTGSDWWVASNVVFQFFPLAFLPLLFTPRSTSKPSTSSSAITAGSLYDQIKIMSTAVYYLALYLALPQVIEASKGSSFSLFKIFKKLFGGMNEGEWLLLWDAIGVTVAAILLQTIDSYAEEQRGKSSKVDARLSLAILFGPGFVLGDLLSRKEKEGEGERLKKD